MPNITYALIAAALAKYDDKHRNPDGSPLPSEPYIEELRKYGDERDEELSREELFAVIGILNKIPSDYLDRRYAQANLVKDTLEREMSDIAKALLTVASRVTLDQQIYDLFAACKHPTDAAYIYALLKDGNLLNANNWELVKNHPKSALSGDITCSPMQDALHDLKRAHILNQETFNYCITHDDPLNVARLCKILDCGGLLNKENYLAIINHSHPNFAELVDTLGDLSDNHKLTQDIIDTVITYGPFVAAALLTLSLKGMRTEDNAALIINHDFPKELSSWLYWLNKSDILNQANFKQALSFISLDIRIEKFLMENESDPRFSRLIRVFNKFSVDADLTSRDMTQENVDEIFIRLQEIDKALTRITQQNQANTATSTAGMFASSKQQEPQKMIDPQGADIKPLQQK